MNNTLILLVGVLLGISIVLMYEANRTRARVVSLARTVTHINSCMNEMIKIDEGLIKHGTNTNNRLSELEKVTL